MTKIFRFFLCFFLMLSSQALTSQSLIGTQSNYAGSRSLSMNPALLNSSYLYFDFSIANLGLSVYNDYAYIKAKDFSRFLFLKEHKFPEYEIDGSKYNFLLYDNLTKPYNMYESLDLNIFNFMYNIDGKQTVAFAFNNRVYTTAKDISHEIPNIMVFGLGDSYNPNTAFFQRYSSSDYSVSTLEWAELLASYSRTLYERYMHKIDMGVSVKYLLAYSAAVANINYLDYEIFSEDSVVVNNIDADLAYSIPINYDVNLSSENLFDRSLVRGNGIAVDFGLSYTNKRDTKSTGKKMKDLCLLPKMDYKWRLGVSIMDLGFVNLNRNATNNSFVNDESVLFDITDYNNIVKFEEMTEYMSATYYDGDPLASHLGDSFRLGLPTTLRLQFDYNLKKNIYLNTTFIQPVRLFEYSAMAVAQILIEARYESDVFEFAVPLSLRDYRFFNVGASMRMGPLTLGTQNIASYLGIGKTNGMDLYVSLKFNLVKGSCKESRYDACWSADFGNPKKKRR